MERNTFDELELDPVRKQEALERAEGWEQEARQMRRVADAKDILAEQTRLRWGLPKRDEAHT